MREREALEGGACDVFFAATRGFGVWTLFGPAGCQERVISLWGTDILGVHQVHVLYPSYMS